MTTNKNNTHTNEIEKNETDTNKVISTSEARVIDDLNASLSLHSHHVSQTLANARRNALAGAPKRWRLTTRNSLALTFCCLAIVGSLYVNTLLPVSAIAPLPIGELNAANGIVMIPQHDLALVEDYQFLTWLNDNANTQ